MSIALRLSIWRQDDGKSGEGRQARVVMHQTNFPTSDVNRRMPLSARPLANGDSPLTFLLDDAGDFDQAAGRRC